MSARRGRRRERMAAAALACGSLAIVFLSLEGVLRFALPERGDWYAAGPRRVAFLREHVTRNADGFRDGPFDRPKTPGVRRILVLGDSFTFGDGIADPRDRWPEVMERALAEKGMRIEVFNAGIPGTNTAWQLDLLRTRGWRWSPDRIVVGFVPNDPEPPGANREAIPARLNPPLLPIGAADTFLTRSSYAYAWLRGRKNALLERFGLKETYADYVASLYRPGPDWDRFVAAARGLAAEAQERGVPLTVAVFPLFHGLEADPFREELDRVVDLFAREGAQIVDLREAYRGIPTSELWIAPGDAHPNERAHRLAGEAVAAALAASEDRVDERGEGALRGQDDEQAEQEEDDHDRKEPELLPHLEEVPELADERNVSHAFPFRTASDSARGSARRARGRPSRTPSSASTRRRARPAPRRA